MFECFPNNYAWSLTTLAALGMGAELGDVDSVVRRLQPLATAERATAEQAWHDTWRATGERLHRRAEAEEAEGRRRSAGRSWTRASVAYATAERHLEHTSSVRMETYREALAAFRKGIDLQGGATEFVDVPFGDAVLPSLFVPAIGVQRPAPCVIQFNGLDSTKEMLHGFHGLGLAERGISLLICDNPGSGESLRLGGLVSEPEAELPAGACVDFLESRPDVDAERIGIVGISMGGYYAPRAAAREARLRCCVAWGAIWDLAPVLDHCTEQGTESVSFDSQLAWVFGAQGEQLWEKIRRYELESVIADVACPLLVLHGENDRQVPVWMAERTHEAAVGSARRDLRIFRRDEGGIEHCNLDDLMLAVDVMHDWLAEVLDARVADPSSVSAPVGGAR